MIEFPAVPAGERIVVSASSFVAYEQCPEKANARYRQEYGPPSRPAFVGGLAHRIFARHLQDGPIGADQFNQVCREEIGSAPALNFRMGELGLKPSQLSGIVSETQALYDRFVRFPTEGFRGAEVSVEVEPQPDVVLQGRVDAVFDEDGRPRLVDWKTGRIFEADDQLGFYALLWVLDRTELPVAVEAVSVKTGERHRTEPSEADLQALVTRIAAMVTALRAGWDSGEAFARVGGPWCTYCPLLDGCSEGRAAATVMAQG
ncbi:MAG: PD-(D/E)XK nuclease family protein [Acidimicrobiia bacterium]|nr:PD-(D/E)XK nuclease family protein [Acidimicrobiia bacterium]NNF10739.1 PD-(D/E)XK nuclease family protein [Acidimicrobiia bacterium]NNL69232.1 PD-(D/E)XK nuclease family protein [Acidimicrobiia bacterium]